MESSSETSTSSSEATGSTALPEDSGAESSSTGTLACSERNPDFDCDPLDCADPLYEWECGGVELDDDGCMRPWCFADADCVADEVCFKHVECDSAAGCDGLAGCGMLDGECTCTIVGGCEDPPPPPEEQRGYCIPPSIRPC